MSLDELRGRIDDIDGQILALLNERAQCAVQIGEIKHNTRSDFYVPEREKAVYEALKAKNTGPLPDRSVRSIYREIMSAMRALERPVAIGYLGPADTFSHMAAMRVFGSRAEYHPLPTVADIFTEVERKRLDYGVVPVETSMGGGVSDTLDRFVTSDTKIINELMLHISQCLMSTDSFDKITQVYSKSQPFVQCRTWLKANLPNAELIETSSTAEAARLVADRPGAAAIAAEMAAETYGLKILARGIEDVSYNFTRFFVIGNQLAKPTGHDKTSVLLGIKDRPGALYTLLFPLAERGVNLTRIESRPSQKKAWEYVFFIELLGHAQESPVKEALEEIARECNELKILGSFPCGELEE